MNFSFQLRRQLRFLTNSCRLFDEGDTDEAIRIATSLRVIFHTTNSSQSLLTHLGCESDLLLLSTVAAIPGQRDEFPLVNIGFKVALGEKMKATPKLACSPHRRFIAFQDWWTTEPILSGGASATRCKLVLWAANKDGGAHVDEKLESRYQSIVNGVGLSFTITSIGEDAIPAHEQVKIPLEDLHLASLRQLGYEVLNSPGLQELSK